MTSKEALNQLYIMADTPELAMDIQSCYDIVEKDLEVLEILKRFEWLVYQKGNKNDWNWYLDEFSKPVELTEEEVKIIEEWLHNNRGVVKEDEEWGQYE